MNLRRKQQLARYALIGGPFILLFVILRLVLPSLSGATRLRLLPDGYEKHDVAGAAASYEVLIAGPDARRKAEAIAGTLDGLFRSATDATQDPFGLDAPGKEVRLVIFAKTEDLERHAAFHLHADLQYNGGYYDPGERTIALPEDGEPAVLEAGLRHEGTHLLFSLSGSLRGLSRWLSEGLACHYEDAPWRAAVLRAKARQALEPGASPPLGELLRAGPEAFQSKENERFYRGAELLVTYLLDGAGPERRQAFIEYVRWELRNGPAPSATELPTRLGASPEALERDLAEWLRTF